MDPETEDRRCDNCGCTLHDHEYDLCDECQAEEEDED